MGLGLDYLAYVRGEMRTVMEKEGRKLQKVARLAVETIGEGRTCWHADIGHMPELEVRVGREARPAIFRSLREPPHDRNIRLAEVRQGDLVVIGDQFDIAEGLIDWVFEAKKRGAMVVGIGASMKEHRSEIPTRHSSGKSMQDVVDIFVDTYAPMGDGALTRGLKTGFAAATGVLNSAIYWALCGEIAERLAKKGVRIPEASSPPNT